MSNMRVSVGGVLKDITDVRVAVGGYIKKGDTLLESVSTVIKKVWTAVPPWNPPTYTGDAKAVNPDYSTPYSSGIGARTSWLSSSSRYFRYLLAEVSVSNSKIPMSDITAARNAGYTNLHVEASLSGIGYFSYTHITDYYGNTRSGDFSISVNIPLSSLYNGYSTYIIYVDGTEEVTVGSEEYYCFEAPYGSYGAYIHISVTYT